MLRLVRQRVGELRFAVLHQQHPAAEASPDRRQDATWRLLGYRDLGPDRPRLVLEVRRGTLRDTDHSRIIDELAASTRQARPDCRIDARREARIERIDVVFLRLDVEGVLQFLELVGIVRCQIVRLAEVLVDVVQFPLEIVRAGFVPDSSPTAAEAASCWPSSRPCRSRDCRQVRNTAWCGGSVRSHCRTYRRG